MIVGGVSPHGHGTATVVRAPGLVMLTEGGVSVVDPHEANLKGMVRICQLRPKTSAKVA